ncbi:MAG: hypothetical protein HGA44_14745, partial [Cellulomonadaceae bacterium]|nr:hypothetical protein [Cellulomonadaceae bacterium]
EFFDWVGGLVAANSLIELAPDLSAVVDISRRQGPIWHFRLVSGNPDEVPLFYSTSTGITEEGELDNERWLATPTRFSVDPTRRLVALEVRRGGVGSVNLERFLSRLAREYGFAERLTLDLNPIPSPSFADEIQRFTRIREAALIVRRPNSDWDDADDVLSSLADNSGGHKASIGVQADRGESLRRSSGIVSLIKSHLVRPLSSVFDAKITGIQEGNATETTVSLTRHQLQSKVEIPRAIVASEGDAMFFDAALHLLERASAIEVAPDSRIER